MAAFSVNAFRDPALNSSAKSPSSPPTLQATPPAEGFDRVYYPGELEHLRTAQKMRDGVEVEDSTWQRLRALAEEYGLAADLALE